MLWSSSSALEKTSEISAALRNICPRMTEQRYQYRRKIRHYSCRSGAHIRIDPLHGKVSSCAIRSTPLSPCQDLGTGSRSTGSGGKRKWVGEAVAMNNNVVSLQISTADIMAINRVDRIVLNPIRTYACTRTARTGVQVTVPLSL